MNDIVDWSTLSGTGLVQNTLLRLRHKRITWKTCYLPFVCSLAQIEDEMSQFGKDWDILGLSKSTWRRVSLENAMGTTTRREEC